MLAWAAVASADGVTASVLFSRGANTWPSECLDDARGDRHLCSLGRMR